MNVKLVQQLRQKVKTKIKAQFESGADRGKEGNRKQVAQKVRIAVLFLSDELAQLA